MAKDPESRVHALERLGEVLMEATRIEAPDSGSCDSSTKRSRPEGGALMNEVKAGRKTRRSRGRGSRAAVRRDGAPPTRVLPTATGRFRVLTPILLLVLLAILAAVRFWWAGGVAPVPPGLRVVRSLPEERRIELDVASGMSANFTVVSSTDEIIEFLGGPGPEPFRLRIGPLPRGYSGMAWLTGPDGSRIAEVSLETPDPMEIYDLSCLPDHEQVQVDISFDGKTGIEVEILEKDGTAVRNSTVRSEPGQGYLHATLAGLNPKTDYRLKVHGTHPWGKGIRHAFRTWSPMRAKRAEKSLKDDLDLESLRARADLGIQPRDIEAEIPEAVERGPAPQAGQGPAQASDDLNT